MSSIVCPYSRSPQHPKLMLTNTILAVNLSRPTATIYATSKACPPFRRPYFSSTPTTALPDSRTSRIGQRRTMSTTGQMILAETLGYGAAAGLTLHAVMSFLAMPHIDRADITLGWSYMFIACISTSMTVSILYGLGMRHDEWVIIIGRLCTMLAEPI
ncbi:hypothetical protein F4778DRAFT_741869 [Xylariomycetidae sp. FL2044]|nr:hypothetical protein F4778DRAFT_741869 [Xylariomycetidae sp. FL2044]